jgi:hypothetical protein
MITLHATDGSIIHVRPEGIEMVSQVGEGAQLTFSSNSAVYVIETVDEVLAIIEGAPAHLAPETKDL